MSEKRDARLDPRPGDVLKKGPWRRLIKSVDSQYGWDMRVKYLRSHMRTNHVNLQYCNTKAGWLRWARSAEIVKRGESDE